MTLRRSAFILVVACLSLVVLQVARAGAAPSGIRAAPGTLAPAAQRTVILVRHAEKGADDPRDPSLSEAGRTRAAALARLLALSKATHLVASEFRRTQETLTPLAAVLGLEVERSPAQDIDALAKIVTSAPAGETIVVAGHSNTVPALATKLGVTLPDLVASPQGPMLADDQYGRVFVLTLPPQGAEVEATVLELAY